MKILFLTFLCVVSSLLSVAQNKTLGVGVPTPNPNAALHVESPTNNQGFIMPRLTTVQRTGMGSLLTTADNGLMLYDTDLKTIYIWDGATWKSTAQVAGGSKLSYPYKDSVTTTLTGNDVFALKYNNAANKRVLRVESLSTTNGNSAVSVQQNGTGIGIFSRVDNPAAGTSAVFGTTNSNLGGALAPVGVYGESSGTGSLGGAFWNTNAANTFPALFAKTLGTGSSIRAETATGFATIYALQSSSAADKSAVIGVHDGTGTGLAGLFQNTNAANTYPAIQAETAGIGPGVKVLQSPTSLGAGVGVFLQNTTSTAQGITVDQQGLGSAANLNILNATSTAAAFKATTDGTGFAGEFRTTNTANNNATLGAESNSNTAGSVAVGGRMTGTGGPAGYFQINNSANNSSALTVFTNGTAAVGYFENTNGANNSPTVFGKSNGNGAVGYFQNTNAANTSSTLYATTNGTGNAIAVRGDVTNVANTNAGVYGSTVGTGVGVYGITTGTTGAAIQGYTATAPTAIIGTHDGAINGNAGRFVITNAANTFPALQANTVGTGSAGNFQVNNAASTNSAVVGQTNGALFSAGVYGNNTGSGFGVVGRSNGTAIGSAAVYGEQLGTGDAAGAFRINNAANTSNAVYGETNGTASAINANQLGTGTGLTAQINNAANSANALRGITNGTGNGILINHTGVGVSTLTNHNLAIFQASGSNVARIDKTGQGLFNGGAVLGGADVAEMFDVEGARESYEPGDVLVISEATDRTVEKSSSASSTKVVGVYATKPGVTLTEKGIDENLDQLVPMGVIGVIPTKVCNENGIIKRGDLLVTSSKAGHAMKAISVKGDGVFPSGVIIGKALENFETGESGLIKVLVNVK
jgi:hypothetical protein